MERYPRDLWMPVAIVLASCILGASIMMGAVLIAKGIALKDTAVSEKALRDLRDEIRILARSREGVALKAPEPAPGSRKVEGVTAGTSLFKGKSSAPVLMVEFSDFQCPYSKEFYRQTFPQIEKEYIATGKVKFAYRDFPLSFHPWAKDAAVACRCAAKQNKYWEMFDSLSKNEALDAESIKKYALESGLNSKAFSDCLKDGEIKTAIDNDANAGARFGIKGTPAFFINGRAIEGAQPFATFKKIIDEELGES